MCGGEKRGEKREKEIRMKRKRKEKKRKNKKLKLRNAITIFLQYFHNKS